MKTSLDEQEQPPVAGRLLAGSRLLHDAVDAKARFVL